MMVYLSCLPTAALEKNFGEFWVFSKFCVGTNFKSYSSVWGHLIFRYRILTKFLEKIKRFSGNFVLLRKKPRKSDEKW